MTLADYEDRAWQALSVYLTRHDTAAPSPRVMVHGFPLGQWVVGRREQFHAGLLSAAEVGALESLPGWVWGSPVRDTWHRSLELVTRYAKQHEATGLSSDVTFEGHRIGTWVRQQRAAHGAGKLASSRIVLLEAVPGWTWQEPERWEAGLSALKRFVAMYGTADVLTTAVIDGYPVGRWVDRIRADQRTNALSADQVQALEALPGWRWSRLTTAWERGLAALRSYASVHASANPPQSTDVNGYALGIWVNEQRRNYRAGRLSPERVAVLEGLAGWVWSVPDQAWADGYSRLQRFVSAGGALPKSGAVVDAYPLGEWVSQQRKQFRADRLPADRVAALEQVPGWRWSVR